MRRLKRKLESSEAGQILLLAVFIGLLLVLMIPVVIFLNKSGTSHQIMSHKKTKGLQLAREGISYATRILSTTPTVWNNAKAGGPFPADCPTGTWSAPIAGSSGGFFKLTCDKTGAQPYQVRVAATALMLDPASQSAQAPIASLQAYVSQKTLGTALATGPTSVSAALQVISVPNILGTGSLQVHWGPIVCSSIATWNLSGVLDQATKTGGTGPFAFPGYPRKFSNGPITGPNYVRTPDIIPANNSSAVATDQKEYWAFASMSLPPLIDTETYKNRAEAMTGLTFTNPVKCWSDTAGMCPGGSGSDAVPVAGFHYVGDARSTFTFSGGMTGVNPATVIFVEGNAWLDDTSYDFRSGALIATGKIILGDGGGGLNDPLNPPLAVPASAAKEYAYWPAGGTQWPCSTHVGQTCGVSTGADPANVGKINFRGFIYAIKTLDVYSLSLNHRFAVAGAVMVGNAEDPSSGALTVLNGESLTILYDDTVAHNVQTVSTELQVDSLSEVAAF